MDANSIKIKLGKAAPTNQKTSQNNTIYKKSLTD